MTQFPAGDLQHEREKVVQAESVSKRALCLPHINTLVLELCQRLCARRMTQVCGSRQRDALPVCVTEAALLCVCRVCGIKAGSGACTDQPASDAESKLRRYTRDACVVFTSRVVVRTQSTVRGFVTLHFNHTSNKTAFDI